VLLLLTWLVMASNLPVADSLDLPRYMGRWYEVARLRNRFQDKCTGDVAATYTLEGDRVRVVNECRTATGVARAEGVARRAAPDGPASRLKVRFAPAWLSWLPAVWGDYQVIELDPDYQWALVGEPGRRYLWILSRTPRLDEATVTRLLDRARALGFPVERMIRTPQS
jgi:apolipoprotein D and lipocalin family protein